eukprot:gnl/TRDRNA2_/TRDRNA2_165576_c0_seq6.p2 gnl/TRDRNA2_/TRDRNA2_165576_c0~~gnl/TRDRNA2_/TRDRNA2_165576_c0_seq6.p2  ORF type:complete len:116 (-),score=7.62 gnl/TRDRNA2_/TRDRNA2_165576_c0_seq6:156-503(-)
MSLLLLLTYHSNGTMNAILAESRCQKDYASKASDLDMLGRTMIFVAQIETSSSLIAVAHMIFGIWMTVFALLDFSPMLRVFILESLLSLFWMFRIARACGASGANAQQVADRASR